MCVCVCVQLLSHDQLFLIPWTVACQAPLSMEFSTQEYWNGLPFPTPGNLPDWTWVFCVSCIGRWILYHWPHWAAPLVCVSVYVCMYAYHMFFISSSVDGHFDYFYVLTVVNSAAVNTSVPVSFQIIYSLNVCPGVRFLIIRWLALVFFKEPSYYAP